MKYRLLIILLLFIGTANSEDTKEPSVDSQNTRQDDEIWLEEKILPTTTWIENLVKPLTIWMEQKINSPEQEPHSQEGDQPAEQKNNIEPNNITEASSLITPEQAGVLAKEHIAGDVLYIKLVSKSYQYRVKLISKQGEIHIIYVNAISGDIVLHGNKKGLKPVELVASVQGIKTHFVSESESERKGEQNAHFSG